MKKKIHRLRPLSIPDMARTLKMSASVLSEWADHGNLQTFPDGTTCLLYVSECLTKAKGPISPEVERLAGQMYTLLETYLYDDVPEAAVTQVDHIMHRMRRSDPAQAVAIMTDLLGPARTVDTRGHPTKTRGYIPGDISNTLQRDDPHDDRRTELRRIEGDRDLKYTLARWHLFGQYDDADQAAYGFKLLTVWCLENGYNPQTGASQRCVRLVDRLPFLRACGLVREGQANEEDLAKVYYKLYRQTANRLMAQAINGAVSSPQWQKEFWQLDQEIADTVAADIRRRQIQKRMPSAVSRPPDVP